LWTGGGGGEKEVEKKPLTAIEGEEKNANPREKGKVVCFWGRGIVIKDRPGA